MTVFSLWPIDRAHLGHVTPHRTSVWIRRINLFIEIFPHRSGKNKKPSRTAPASVKAEEAPETEAATESVANETPVAETETAANETSVDPDTERAPKDTVQDTEDAASATPVEAGSEDREADAETEIEATDISSTTEVVPPLGHDADLSVGEISAAILYDDHEEEDETLTF